MNSCPCLPEAIRELQDDYRRDKEKLLERYLEELNNKVQSEATVRNFRPLSPGAFMNRALRLTENSFTFYFDLQDFLTQWIINNGVEWSLEKAQKNTSELCLFTLRWLKNEGKFEE